MFELGNKTSAVLAGLLPYTEYEINVTCKPREGGYDSDPESMKFNMTLQAGEILSTVDCSEFHM